MRPVDEKGGGGVEVVDHLRFIFRAQAAVLDSRLHVPEPGISLGPPDGEVDVTHAKPRVPALSAVVPGTAPVLDEEGGQMLPGPGQIFRVQGSEDWIPGHPFIKAVDQCLKPGTSTGAFVESAHQKIVLR